MTVKVRCTYVIEVELPDDYAVDERELRFRIEENGCPGTGVVGAAFDAVYEEGEEKEWCWACEMQGENKVIEIDGRAV